MTLNDGSSVTIVVNQSYNHQQIQTLTDHFCRIVASLFIDLKCVLNKHKVRFKSVSFTKKLFKSSKETVPQQRGNQKTSCFSRHVLWEYVKRDQLLTSGRLEPEKCATTVKCCSSSSFLELHSSNFLNTLFYNMILKQLKKHKMAPYSSSDIIQVYICTHNLLFLRALAQTSSSPWNKGVNNVFLK